MPWAQIKFFRKSVDEALRVRGPIMKTVILLLVAFALIPTAQAAQKSLQTIFNSHNVKLQQISQEEGMDTFLVELPFDPLEGGKLWELRKEILVLNNCRPFSIISLKDQTRFKYSASMKSKNCIVTEQVEPYTVTHSN
jgi:hypothetical protein